MSKSSDPSSKSWEIHQLFCCQRHREREGEVIPSFLESVLLVVVVFDDWFIIAVNR